MAPGALRHVQPGIPACKMGQGAHCENGTCSSGMPAARLQTNCTSLNLSSCVGNRPPARLPNLPRPMAAAHLSFSPEMSARRYSTINLLGPSRSSCSSVSRGAPAAGSHVRMLLMAASLASRPLSAGSGSRPFSSQYLRTVPEKAHSATGCASIPHALDSLVMLLPLCLTRSLHTCRIKLCTWAAAASWASGRSAGQGQSARHRLHGCTAGHPAGASAPPA